MAQKAVIGLGSNLGDRLANLRRAVTALREIVDVVKISPVYETEPVGGPPQGSFLNAAALVLFEKTPRELLERLLAIEKAMGRERRERWGPRGIDLDILWIENVVLCESGLEVPHPRLLERVFAREPFWDVAPDAVDPRTNSPFFSAADRRLLRRVHSSLS